MKCSPHQAEAIGICAYCGKALCPECSRPANSRRLVCSAECDAALLRGDKAIEMVLDRSVQSARASAFYSYLCAGLSAAGAVGAWFWLPVPFLVWFTAGCSLVFLVSGWWYGRMAGKQNS